MNITKRYTFMCNAIRLEKSKAPIKSKRWVKWVAVPSPGICTYCLLNHGHIFDKDDNTIVFPKVHQNCNCSLEELLAFYAGTVTNQGTESADMYLALHHELPSYYLTKSQARALGWIRLLGNLSDILPGRMIGGDVYHNWEGKLPSAPDRIWYEADFDYTAGFRNGCRILYSNDGLMFFTKDHYSSFSEIIWEGYDDEIFN